MLVVVAVVVVVVVERVVVVVVERVVVVNRVVVVVVEKVVVETCLSEQTVVDVISILLPGGDGVGRQFPLNFRKRDPLRIRLSVWW